MQHVRECGVRRTKRRAGKVQTFRSQSAQTKLAGGTGDCMRHLIGGRFGAPADAMNLCLQNANSNTRVPKAKQYWAGKGGNCLELENRTQCPMDRDLPERQA